MAQMGDPKAQSLKRIQTNLDIQTDQPSVVLHACHGGKRGVVTALFKANAQKDVQIEMTKQQSEKRKQETNIKGGMKKESKKQN